MTRVSTNYSNIVTATRASSGTFIGSNGLLQTAAQNVPRIEYDADGNLLGLLVEEARTNLLTYSTNLENEWNVVNGVTVTEESSGFYAVTSDGSDNGRARPDPVATVNGDILTGSMDVDARNSSDGAFFDMTVGTTGGHRVFSRLTVSGDVLTIATPEATNSTLAVAGFVGLKDLSGGKWRVSFSAKNISMGNQDWVLQLWRRDGTDVSIHIRHPQLELGATPSSHIPTNGAAATRAADLVSIPAGSFPYNTKAITIHMEGDLNYADTNDAGNHVYFSWASNTSNRIFTDLDTDGASTGEINFHQVFSGQTDRITGPEDTYAPGLKVPYNFISVHEPTRLQGAIDGQVLTANTTPTELPNLSAADIELFPTGFGHIKNFNIYPRALTDTQITTLTA